MFSGSIVALATPFLDGGEVDYERLKKLIDFQIANGTKGIVSMGTTGESATMSHEEDVLITKFIVDYVNRRVPVIAGTGSNSTREAVSLTEAAKRNKAAAALVVVPYYNKPTQEGLYQHYKYIAETVDIPVIIYNVPGRTGTSIAPETVARLSKVPNICGIKEASGAVDNCMQILRLVSNFTVLCGDDSITLPMMALGAKGVISVAANAIPERMAMLCQYMLDNDYASARRIHYECLDLFRLIFIESNPIPIKAALAMQGLMEERYRLPLVPMDSENREKLRQCLAKLKVI
jgi:4-hydroxy-tetrahydrodipicolinate synthase